jgi:hypothetical protein
MSKATHLSKNETSVPGLGDADMARSRRRSANSAPRNSPRYSKFSIIEFGATVDNSGGAILNGGTALAIQSLPSKTKISTSMSIRPSPPPPVIAGPVERPAPKPAKAPKVTRL